MAFGVKTKNIKTQNSYTIESFFDAIKDKEFTAGTPSLTKHGMATVITFPALDSQNQVWIMKSGFGKETQKFSIQKSTQAGMDNVAKNAALDSITGGLFSVGGMISENTKKCEKLVDATAKELSEMITLGFFPGAFIDTKYNRVVFTGGDPTKAKAAVGQASGHSSRYVMVKCKGCGATNKILSGTVGECEYCGSRLSAN